MEQTHSIRDLVRDIDRGIICLPEFQRDFVWELPKTYDLFDSLVKNIFIGAIIYGIPSFDIAVRDIDDRKRSSQGKKRFQLKTRTITKIEIDEKQRSGQANFKLVLDGQQRITSLYRALKGVDEVWFNAKNEDELEGQFLNLSLEELLHEISNEALPDKLGIKISDVWTIEQGDFDDEEIKETFFFETPYYKANKLDPDFDKNLKSEFKKFKKLRSKLADLLKSEKLIAFYLLDMNLEKFVVFFERSNTRGVQLNFIDILGAKLYAGKFNLKNKIQEFKADNPNYTLIPEIIVRAIAYIKSNAKEIHRNYILHKLEANDFETWWDKFCLYYKKTLDFLHENHYLIAQHWLPYENIFIPLINFVNEIGGDYHLMNASQKKFIEFWYWSAIFSQRFAGSFDSYQRVIEDSNMLILIAQNKRISSLSFFARLTKTQILTYEDIYSFNRKTNAIYKGILNLINFEQKGLINWNNDSKLSTGSALEDHHIFPKNYLSKILINETDKDLIDCVANRTLIPKLQNIRINNQKPSEYLNEIKKSNPNLEKSLENHLITSDLLSDKFDKEYMFFIEMRAKAIFSIIKRIVLDPKEAIKNEYYEEVKHDEAINIAIFTIHRNTRIEATFNPATKKVFYKGDLFDNPTAATIAVKKEYGMPENVSENGWNFWKFIDTNNMERKILELK